MKRVLVVKVEVEVDEAGGLHAAYVTNTGSEDHEKITERKYEHVGEALDSVLGNLLGAKLSAAAAMRQMSGGGQVGNA